MAIAKPIRALALVSLGLLVFFLYQITQKPIEIHGPGDLEKEMPNDPMKDGGYRADRVGDNTHPSQKLTNHQSPCGGQTNMQPIILTLLASTRHY